MTTKVMIIDDDQAIRESMKKILQREDYEVALAVDGRAALELVDPNRIDLLLLDLDLPEHSGWDVFGDFTARRPSLPVIVITGHSGQYPVAQAAGVDAFMEKPIDVPKLLQTMKDVLAEPEEQRLRRRLGHGGQPCHVPASARMIFESYLGHHSAPAQPALPGTHAPLELKWRLSHSS